LAGSFIGWVFTASVHHAVTKSLSVGWCRWQLREALAETLEYLSKINTQQRHHWPNTLSAIDHRC
jgi:hypothetical protein